MESSATARMLVAVTTLLSMFLHGCNEATPPPEGLQLSYTWATREELEASPWHDYLLQVYATNLSSMTFPFSLLQLHFFHTRLLPSGTYKSLSVRQQKPFDVQIIGRKLVFGDLYRLWGGNEPDTPWDDVDIFRCIYPVGLCTSGPVYNSECTGDIQVDYFSYGLPSHSRVEVVHNKGDPSGSGMWFYWARGSGIYLDLGKTVVYRDHQNFAKFCNVTGFDQELTSCGAKLGYDTVQFTHHNEGIFKYEVLDTRTVFNQTNGCPDEKHASLFSTGWGGIKPCVCDGSKAYLNCDGTSTLKSLLPIAKVPRIVV